VMAASMLKFVGGPLAGITLGLTWFETTTLTIVGMMTSVVLFTILGQVIEKNMARYRKQKPKLFSRRTRIAVRVWSRFGIRGIAMLTPLLFTPIGGTLLALSFKVPKGQLLLWMLFFAVFWGILVTLAVYQIPWLRGVFA
jgi:uncharacterized membrane protein